MFPPQRTSKNLVIKNKNKRPQTHAPHKKDLKMTVHLWAGGILDAQSLEVQRGFLQLHFGQIWVMRKVIQYFCVLLHLYYEVFQDFPNLPYNKM
jgi:hypothetical protein